MEVTEGLMTAPEARDCTERIRRRDRDQRRDLLEMDEREGWKALDYPSWRAWAVAEFGQASSTLYQQLEAARIERNLSAYAEPGSIPEFHLRPLAALKTPEEQRFAWEEANATAPGGKLTGAHVRQVVAELLPDHVERLEAAVRERQRLDRLKDELDLPEVDAEAERARISRLYAFFRALETLADMPPPAEVAALIRPDQEHYLRGIVAAQAWLSQFLTVWEKR